MLNIYNIRKMEKEVMHLFIELADFLENMYQQIPETPEVLKQKIDRGESPFYSLGNYLTNVYTPLMKGDII